MRELAGIQTFPPNHKFVGKMTQIILQIGNAFPPVVVEILIRHLIKWLMQQDQVVSKPIEQLQTWSSITENRSRRKDIVVIDSDEEVGTLLQCPNIPEPIIIDDDDNEGDCDQRIFVWPNEQNNTGSRVEDAILIDDSRDVVMRDTIDVVEEHLNYSRESSCTLSDESLPSLFEIEVDNNSAEVGRVVGRYLEA